ncbi:MAG: gamma-glutamyltransferase, partial [Oceanospirillum sp.]|nr:gamma-glutamyltransferase [Oceanospirillum sp.]
MIKNQPSLRYAIGITVAIFSTAGPAQAQQVADNLAPEAASGFETKAAHTAEKFIVTAANPYAVEAGYQILKEGGSAIDAMVAVQTVLGLT